MAKATEAAKPLVMVLPIGTETDFVGVVDVLERKSYGGTKLVGKRADVPLVQLLPLCKGCVVWPQQTPEPLKFCLQGVGLGHDRS